MEAVDWESVAEQRKRRQVKKRNTAFRLRLQAQKEARRDAARLKLASVAAAMSWAIVGIQLIR